MIPEVFCGFLESVFDMILFCIIDGSVMTPPRVAVDQYSGEEEFLNHRYPWRGAGNAVVVALLVLILLLPETGRADFSLPPELREKVDVVSTFDSNQVVTATEQAAYAEQRRVATDLIGNALMAVGKGGVYEGKVVRVRQAFPIYRVYSAREYARTGRSRIGGWWTSVPPGRGISRAEYRRRYEICESFNPDLDRVVACRVYPGALLVIGPGQSVDEKTCGRAGEGYAADSGKRNLQVYLADAFRHEFIIRDDQTPLQDIEHYIGCPSDAADRPYDWYSGGEGAQQ
jgi:hypothetical protein